MIHLPTIREWADAMRETRMTRLVGSRHLARAKEALVAWWGMTPQHHQQILASESLTPTYRDYSALADNDVEHEFAANYKFIAQRRTIPNFSDPILQQFVRRSIKYIDGVCQDPEKYGIGQIHPDSDDVGDGPKKVQKALFLSNALRRLGSDYHAILLARNNLTSLREPTASSRRVSISRSRQDSISLNDG